MAFNIDDLVDEMFILTKTKMLSGASESSERDSEGRETGCSPAEPVSALFDELKVYHLFM